MDASERRRRAGEEAAEWWVLLDSENGTLETRTAFVDWLRESALHVEEMLRVAQVHGALEQFQRWADLSTNETGQSGTPADMAGKITSFPLPPRSQDLRRSSRPRRTWLGVGFATAAAA